MVQKPIDLALPANDSPNPAFWHDAVTEKWGVELAFLQANQAVGGAVLALYGHPIS
jgi:hypothetical protein